MHSIPALFLALLLRISIVRGEAGTVARSPFLSTTLSAKIASVSSSDDADFDSGRRATFSETLTRFLHKIFEDQNIYDVRIISVNIFDDHVLRSGRYEGKRQGERGPKKEESDGGEERTLSFSTVVAAEYTKEASIDGITSDGFRKMLVHVCDKFQDHLLKFMKDSGDPYFVDVESVVLGDFERWDGGAGAAAKSSGGDEASSGGGGDTVAIVVIVVGSILFVVFAYASAKLYRREKELKEVRLKSKEIVAFSSTKSAGLSLGGMQHATHPVDDYSFSPLASGCIKRYVEGVASPLYTNYRDDPIRDEPIRDEPIRDDPIRDDPIRSGPIRSSPIRDDPIHGNPSIEEEVIDFSSVWPESAPPARPPADSIFPAPGAVTREKATLSYTDELNRLPQQHVFAPPGKIGVAIDVYNGQPVVHKVRRNSPLEKMLKPNDVIVAIDDEDASCLSAADVTSMMVKRMDRVRKITFIRRR